MELLLFGLKLKEKVFLEKPLVASSQYYMFIEENLENREKKEKYPICPLLKGNRCLFICSLSHIR